MNLTPWRKENTGSGALAPRTEHPLSRIRDEFDALFDRFFSRFPAGVGFGDSTVFWGLDVHDTGKEVTVRAEAPGFEVGDFDVQAAHGVLTIRAERKQESQDKSNGTSYSERRLYRTVTLPPGTDANQVEAHYRNGILELRFAKSPEAQVKRIEIKKA